jgi:hypothetical protein
VGVPVRTESGAVAVVGVITKLSLRKHCVIRTNRSDELAAEILYRRSIWTGLITSGNVATGGIICGRRSGRLNARSKNAYTHNNHKKKRNNLCTFHD